MKLYRLQTVHRIPVSLDEAWAFFSNPTHLSFITPPWLDFQLTNEAPEHIRPGTIITYTIRPIWRVPVHWVTEVTHMDAPHLFVDEQRFGPYRFWHHQHHFRPVEHGVEVEDLVHYMLPLGPIGALAHAATVQRRLQEIFEFRRQALTRRYGSWKPLAEVPA